MMFRHASRLRTKTITWSLYPVVPLYRIVMKRRDSKPSGCSAVLRSSRHPIPLSYWDRPFIWSLLHLEIVQSADHAVIPKFLGQWSHSHSDGYSRCMSLGRQRHVFGWAPCNFLGNVYILWVLSMYVVIVTLRGLVEGPALMNNKTCISENQCKCSTVIIEYIHNLNLW